MQVKSTIFEDAITSPLNSVPTVWHSTSVLWVRGTGRPSQARALTVPPPLDDPSNAGTAEIQSILNGLNEPRLTAGLHLDRVRGLTLFERSRIRPGNRREPLSGQDPKHGDQLIMPHPMWSDTREKLWNLPLTLPKH